MATKWCTKLEVAEKRCPIIFQGHLSNFQVTGKKIADFDSNWMFIRTVTQVWIHQWLWNDAQGLTWCRRGALLFFNIIHQISRSRETKISSILTRIERMVYSDVDQRKHQSSASLAFVWGFHRGPVNSPHKWPVSRKMFPFHDVIMRNYWYPTEDAFGEQRITSFSIEV